MTDKEKLEEAKRLYKTANADQKYVLESLFPELKESEDERIRQKFIKLVKMSSEVGGFALHKWEADKMLAWLEKQGEKKNINPTFIEKEKMDNAFTKMMLKGKTALEAIHEEKVDNANKTVPTFKVGDWVVKGNTIAQILDIQEQYYVGLDIDGNDFTSSRFLSDDKIHLWTIEDAKDGDVLDANGAPFIYKKHDKDCVYYYCGVNLAGEFIEANGITWNTWNNNNKVYPATKEQRDLLFQKMKELGYEWDSEKKELRKMEQKPKWSEEDSLMIDSIIDTIKWLEGKGATDMKIDWLMSLKQRMEEQV